MYNERKKYQKKKHKQENNNRLDRVRAAVGRTDGRTRTRRIIYASYAHRL